MGRHGVRVLVATALAGFALAWPAYVYLWQRGGAEPLTWRAEQAQERAVRPRLEVTRSGGVARVLLALGPRSSTGYRLAIERVEEQRGRVLLVMREHSPRLGDRVQPRVTYPALVVLLPDRDKPVQVERR